MGGQYVTSIRTARLHNRNGITAFVALASEIFAIELVMNKHTPTGGDVRPITRFKTHMTPN